MAQEGQVAQHVHGHGRAPHGALARQPPLPAVDWAARRGVQAAGHTTAQLPVTGTSVLHGQSGSCREINYVREQLLFMCASLRILG